VVSSPRVSTGPAGCRISRDCARRGWATETGHPSWGPGTEQGPGLERFFSRYYEKWSVSKEHGRRTFEKRKFSFFLVTVEKRTIQSAVEWSEWSRRAGSAESIET